MDLQDTRLAHLVAEVGHILVAGAAGRSLAEVAGRSLVEAAGHNLVEAAGHSFAEGGDHTLAVGFGYNPAGEAAVHNPVEEVAGRIPVAVAVDYTRQELHTVLVAVHNRSAQMDDHLARLGCHTTNQSRLTVVSQAKGCEHNVNEG